MSETTEQAATPAEIPTETNVSSEIIDLDAPAEAQVDPDEEKPEPKPDADDKDDGEKEEARKKLSGAQRAKIREGRLAAENAELARQVEELRRSTQAQKASESDEKPPREEDFNGDYFAWQRALTAFEAGKAAEKAIAKQFQTREQAERTTKQTEIARERAVAHLERVEDAREVIADFDSVMDTMKGVNVRSDVIDEIMSSDQSAAIAYHLAKNPTELQAMNSMSARELARAMGRLEATVRLPSPKKQTTAPPPLSSVKGGASPSSAESDLNAWLKKTYG